LIKLTGKSERVYKQLSGVAEILLDKPDMLIEKGEENLLEVSAEDMLTCLKRLQSSLKLWTKEGGRQGYLNYISQFV
jgi:rRNA pseudouridine-1189 N-methylase Emg1 (Nep1/Mra1 family)